MPVADHHQHLLSPEGAALANRLFDLKEVPLDAAGMVASLDQAGIERALVVSNAYYFDATESRDIPGSEASVRRENDWMAAQAARFPRRLVAFCSVNPLMAYALSELDRCAARPEFRGLKLHLGASGIDLLNGSHVAQVQQVLRRAAAHKLPVIIHAAPRGRAPYGEQHARVFIEQLLPHARTVPVVMAHLWGGGRYAPEALKVYAQAAATGGPATRNLYFEVAQAASAGIPEEAMPEIAARMREIGFDRIFYGSDGPQFGGLPPREAWAEFRSRVPLSPQELARLASNVAPFLKKAPRRRRAA